MVFLAISGMSSCQVPLMWEEGACIVLSVWDTMNNGLLLGFDEEMEVSFCGRH